ncbi:MAG: spermidine/putrescine ABC transporter ATP-binding protein [Actinomycetales bacterium mxb001]|nr:MAG: spermidine/putrescine ABC transporter ATP-binding protein [Actinomycetales bacterium mxb001]
MATVLMSGIRKEFGSTVALSDFTLEIESGELICLLGPSGCGKTTALRVLAGFEKPDAGTVIVGGEDITSLPTAKRNFGMVFQEYSLFPNMTGRANVEFALKLRKAGSAERKETVDRLLTITGLTEHADKFPHQMSGGQRQRVALARALASQPRVLLLDEPLSALDAKVRDSLREEIRRVQREVGVTTLFVTHDQHEALAIADRVGVMSNGRLEQLDPPRALYERPASAFVAGFVGTVNRLPAEPEGDRWRVLNRSVSAQATMQGAHLAVIRPEQLMIDPDASGDATVTEVTFLGPLTRVVVKSSGQSLIADLLTSEFGGVNVGDQVRVRLRDDVTDVVLIEA